MATKADKIILAMKICRQRENAINRNCSFPCSNLMMMMNKGKKHRHILRREKLI